MTNRKYKNCKKSGLNTQGVVTYMSPVEAFATGIKMESSNQSRFTRQSSGQGRFTRQSSDQGRFTRQSSDQDEFRVIIDQQIKMMFKSCHVLVLLGVLFFERISCYQTAVLFPNRLFFSLWLLTPKKSVAMAATKRLLPLTGGTPSSRGRSLFLIRNLYLSYSALITATLQNLPA